VAGVLAADRDQIAAGAVVDGVPTAMATRVTLWGLLGVHTVHYPEVMLCLLIIILRLDRIPSYNRGICKRDVALVLPSGAPETSANPASRRGRAEARSGTALPCPLARISVEVIRRGILPAL